MNFPPRSRLTRPLILAACVGGALAACVSPTAPVMRANLTAATDRATYSLAAEDVPLVSLRHEGGPAVIISGCPKAPAAILERRDEGGWHEEASSGIICLGIYSIETDTIGPGTVRSFPFPSHRPGTYRVRVLIGPDVGAPQRTVLTREFDVQ